MNETTEERLAELLALLPPAPSAWVEAAQEISLGRAQLDEIVARAEEDAAFRQALIANLESTLAAEGYEPKRPLLDVLRDRLDRG
jgi:hypothetical protein